MSGGLMLSKRAVLGFLFLAGCAETPVEPPVELIEEGAPVSFAVVYQADLYTEFGYTREWIPMDVAADHNGRLWVVQQMQRDGGYDDDSECISRVEAPGGAPNDCVSLQGSTVTITDPAAVAPATAGNGRANTVVDYNALHFMRRPSGIAFGEPELVLRSGDIGALDPITGAPLVDGTRTFTDIFATSHEHWTGNLTDQPSFIGPTLWTGDPGIYNGNNGTEAWSNGAHLDMLHGTEYAMGIAHEAGTVFWTSNGTEGTLDRYNFNAPHFPGGSNHDDGEVARYDFGGDALVRTAGVPSNMIFDGTDLFIADSGNGRVVRLDTTAPTSVTGSFFTFEGLEGDVISASFQPVASSETLAAEWGGTARPSGLAVLRGLLVVGSFETGHITLLNRDGTVVRTIDTGLGRGLAGLTVLNETIYLTHTLQRRLYRVDVMPEEML